MNPCVALPLFVLLLVVPWGSSYTIPQSYLQCLSNYPSDPTKPISEAIYTPANPSFTSVLEAYIRNKRFLTPTTPKPQLIVTAMHESHIQATIVCSKSHGLQIRIRSGGHDLEGVSYVSDVPFVILDMFNLRAIDFDIPNETAWVQAGATLGELYYGIAQRSKTLAFPGGICYEVGTGGHFSGGGYGNLMRKYGLSVDNIIDAKIVNVKGQILDRKSMGENLFWAIRGGGAASFGVVLAWKVKLVRVPETVTYFRVEKTIEQGATEVVYQWQEVADKLDRDLFIRLRLEVVDSPQGVDNKTVRAAFIGMFLGQGKELVQLMAKSFPKLGLQEKDCIETSWLKTTLPWYDLPLNTSTSVALDRIPESIGYSKTKSDYVKVPIPKRGLEALWKELLDIGEAGVQLQWNPYGGKMSDISETATPFPHRAGNIYKIQYIVNWREPASGGIDAATSYYINVSRRIYDFMTPYVSKNPREAFLNYRDFDLGENMDNATNYKKALTYGTKYFKKNFFKLVRVKGSVDPENFFKNEQSIPLDHHVFN